MIAAEVVPEQLSAPSHARSAVTQASWWTEHVAVDTRRERIASLGLRTARERITLLFCEVYFRLRLNGQHPVWRCKFPPTRADLAKATGLIPVHVNRMVQEPQCDGLIAWAARTLTILDFGRLRAMTIFTPACLHHDRTVATG